MELVKYISLSVLVICATACSKSIDVDVYVDESKVPDSSQISMMVAGESFTRAIPDEFEVESEEKMGTVGFYCAYTAGADWVDSEKDFTTRYNNTKFTYDTGASAWATTREEAKEWNFNNITDKYTFYAYSPYSSGSKKEGIKPSLDAAGDLNITDYTIPTATADMVDLLAATPRVDIHPQSGGKVSMVFNHALARVKFKAKVDKAITPPEIVGEITSDMFTPPGKPNVVMTSQVFGDPYIGAVKVTGITWKSLSNKATLKMSANSASIAWINHSVDDSDRSIGVLDLQIETDEEHVTNASDITEEYLLIPQICNAMDDEITVNLDIITQKQQWTQRWNKTGNKPLTGYPPYQDESKNIEYDAQTKVIKLSQSSLSKIEMGKVYDLTIVIPTDAAAYETDDFGIEVTVSEWSDAEVNIPNFN